MREYLQKYRHIILVDDDSDDRELFAEAIAFVDPAIQVTVKQNGEELMDHLNGLKTFPDAIFLDLNMPRKNGKECLSELRIHEDYANIPVIIYTTSLNPTDIEETYNDGADYFLRKPNSFEELKNMLGSLLNDKVDRSTPRRRENFVINHVPNLIDAPHKR